MRPPFKILLVEDNPADAELTEMSLQEAKILTSGSQLFLVTDGQEAIDFLHQRGAHADAPRPDFILLDLNLPKMDGREVLAEIKAHDELKIIPVTVLTSSRADEDVLKAYKLHANCYVRKPTGVDEFQAMVNALRDFWFGMVNLPPHS